MVAMMKTEDRGQDDCAPPPPPHPTPSLDMLISCISKEQYVGEGNKQNDAELQAS